MPAAPQGQPARSSSFAQAAPPSGIPLLDALVLPTVKLPPVPTVTPPPVPAVVEAPPMPDPEDVPVPPPEPLVSAVFAAEHAVVRATRKAKASRMGAHYPTSAPRRQGPRGMPQGVGLPTAPAGSTMVSPKRPMNVAPRSIVPFLAVLSLAAPAAAGDPKPVEVLVTPKGQSWSVGPYGGQECDPTCYLRVPADTYPVAIGGAKQEVPILSPMEITYSPGSPKLHTVGLWTMIGGVGAGGVILGLGIYGYVNACTGSSCPALNFSRTTDEVLVTTAAILISISVAGAILFAVTGESIGARDVDLPASAPGPVLPPPRSFDVSLVPSSHGATLDFVKLF
jgi:hypothetical protein